MARSDTHRVSQIRPEEYTLVLCYALASTQDGWPVPSIGVNCELDRRTYVKNPDGTETVVNGTHSEDGRCCIIGMRRAGLKFAEHGGTGKCTVCGTHFTYGDVWFHEPTGEHIHVGHTCSDKYNLIADRREFERELGKARVRSAREHEKAMKQEARDAFLDSEPGLREALETDHDIVRDIKDRFENGRYTSLTEKQVALVKKLHRESKRPRVEETNVPAVIAKGRQTVEGEVVSVKFQDGYYGVTCRMTVKVRAEGGVWLVWGTCPQSLLDEEGNKGGRRLRGSTVRFDAKLKQGRDPHFALLSRPTKATVVEWAPEDVEEAA
jgi:hypothetical protein